MIRVSMEAIRSIPINGVGKVPLPPVLGRVKVELFRTV
jgi:hypothetical protein